MPLCSATAYTSFIKRMASARTPNVIVHMDPPKAPTTAALVCIFWYTSTHTDVTLSHGQLPVCQAHQNLLLTSMKGSMMTVSPIGRRYDLLHHSFSHQLILTHKPRFDDELDFLSHRMWSLMSLLICQKTILVINSSGMTQNAQELVETLLSDCSRL